tara:strand:+ start:657 stop:1379 length:723 start_codon:yes stop_codon:yes gene_type:complete
MAKNKYGGNKPKPNKGEDLKGLWLVTLKLDGARMHRDVDGNPISRAGKPLYNLDHIDKEIVDAEVYDSNWETSMSLVRSSVNGSPVAASKVYSIDPLDPRMDLGEYTDPTHALLTEIMLKQIAKGFEGLVVRQGDKWLKYKPSDSADVYVTGFQAGTGKHKGKMGALLTNYGKVGTGFSDADRERWQMLYELHGIKWLTSQLIQVSFMEWTKGGKFRHPAFECIRDDKLDEHLGEAYEAK